MLHSINIVFPTQFHSFEIIKSLQAGSRIVYYTIQPKKIKERLRKQKIENVEVKFLPISLLIYLLFRVFSNSTVLRERLRTAFHLSVQAELRYRLNYNSTTIVASGFARYLKKFDCAKGMLIIDHGSLYQKFERDTLEREQKIYDFTGKGVWQNKRVMEWQDLEYKKADKIVVASELALDTFPSDLKHKISVCKIPVENNDFSFSEGPKGEAITFVVAGSISIHKGVHRVMQVLESIEWNWNLFLVGEISNEPQIQSFMSANNSSGIKALGFVSKIDLCNVFKNSDCIIHNSLSDGFAMVVAQALTCGCFGIVSENTGAKCLITNNRHGLITDVQDDASLRMALNYVKKNIISIRADRAHRSSGVEKLSKNYKNEYLRVVYD